MSSLFAATATAQDAESFKNTAANAQNEGEFELAASQWEQLLEQYPKSKHVGVANHFAGVCYYQTKQFVKAIDKFKAALKSLKGKEAKHIPDARFFLGYSQMELGKMLVDDNAQLSKELLTHSTETFGSVIKEHPEFKDIDQVYFFQGRAFVWLELNEEAKSAFLKMFEQSTITFEQSGHQELGYCYRQSGDHGKAVEYFQKFLAGDEDHVATAEIRFQLGESFSNLANEAKESNESERANQFFTNAQQAFAACANDEGSDRKSDAKFRQAYCTSELGETLKAAQLYAEVASIPDSKMAARALTYSGREYSRINKDALALEKLNRALTLGGPYAAEAAHWVSLIHLKAKQFDKAYLVANEWVDKTDDDRFKIPLMMDRADAAFGTKARKKDSTKLYLEIADQFPNHRLASTALYNSAFGASQDEDYDLAIKLVDRFIGSHQNSDFVPDALEIKGDCYLLKDDSKSAEAIFRVLAEKIPNHEKASNWILRAGLSAYKQEAFERVTEWFEPRVKDLDSPKAKAEAFHWMGSSHMRLAQTDQAIEDLKQSSQTSSDWSRADETLMTLSKAYAAKKLFSDATQIIAQLIRDYGDSPLMAEAFYQQGQYAYVSKDFAEAEASYDAVLANFSDSKFAPFALYGKAWAQHDRENFEGSAESFLSLLDKYPKHELHAKALVGRTKSLRESGDSTGAVMAARKAVETTANGSGKVVAMYELGLAQIKSSQWPDVIQTFTSLIEMDPDSKSSDRYHYELAWAYRETTNSESDEARVAEMLAKSLEHFKTLAEKFPKSDFAAESSFHVGQSAYDKGDFDAAVSAYQRSLAVKGPTDINEKARYKLGCSFYRKQEYDNSLVEFRRQATDHANGPLLADGLFMISESLYETQDHEGALKAYTAAKPVVMASKAVSPQIRYLTLLHGAQSANEAKQFAVALEFAQPLLEGNVQESIKHDAYLEMGDANSGLGNKQESLDAWSKAAASTSETGAQARCRMGDRHSIDGDIDKAITQYKLVFFGYGGQSANASVKEWQAYARYEAARCCHRLISSTEDKRLKLKYRDDAIKHFRKLLDNYPDDRLATEAKRQLKLLLQN